MSGKQKGIPVSQEKVKARLRYVSEQSSKEQQDNAWALFLAALKEESDINTMDGLCNIRESIEKMADTQSKASALSKRLLKISGDIEFVLPHPHIATANIRTTVDLEATERKVKRNALYSGIGIYCAGLSNMDGYNLNRVWKVLKIAECLDAEVQTGRNTYANIVQDLYDTGEEP